MLLLRFLQSLGHSDSLNLGLPLLLEFDATLLDIVALDDFVVPEFLDLLLFILLRTSQVLRHFLEVEGSISLITVRHQLVLNGSFSVLVLELEVGDCLRGEVHLDRWLVRLVVEVPNIHTVILGDEDHTWARRREGATSVLGATRVRGSEDWLVAIQHRHFPDSEVEVMDREQKVIVEG